MQRLVFNELVGGSTVIQARQNKSPRISGQRKMISSPVLLAQQGLSSLQPACFFTDDEFDLNQKGRIFQ